MTLDVLDGKINQACFVMMTCIKKCGLLLLQLFFIFDQDSGEVQLEIFTTRILKHFME